MTIVDTNKLLPTELNKLVRIFGVGYAYPTNNLINNTFWFNMRVKIVYTFESKSICLYVKGKKVMDITQFHIGNVSKIIEIINNNQANIKDNEYTTYC